MQNFILPRHVQSPDPTIYLSGRGFGLDWETTNIDKGSALNPDNQLVLGCYQEHGQSIRASWGNELAHGAILEAIDRHDFLIGFNIKFELQWLQRIGARLENLVVYDPMIAEYVIAGNRKWALDLDSVAARYGLPQKDNAVKAMIKRGVCPSEIPASWLERYCRHDVSVALEIFKRQLPIVQELGLLSVVYTRCLLTPVLADIEFNGMHLDKEAVYDKYNEVRDALVEAELKLQSYGQINWNSGPQVAELLYDRLGFDVPKNYRGEDMMTAGGKRATNAAAFAALKPRNKAQREFIDAYKKWRKLDDQMTKYMSKVLDCVNENDGILQAKFNQTVTRTHRLSSSGAKYKIQFQNFDRKLKPLFSPRHEGWYLEENDGASLEFRTAGHIGRDARIISDIREGVDVHRFTASVLNGCSEDAVTDEQRTYAKRDTFKPLYGGQSGTESQQRYYKAFREKYPGITGTQNSWIKTVLRDKVLVTETGLRFYWPDTKVTRTGYITNRESICNYPVQSLATADIIPVALVYQWHKMKARYMQSFIVNTVHDSIVAELHPDETEVYGEDVIESFTTDVYRYLKKVYNITFTCPLGLGSKIGQKWGVGLAEPFARRVDYLDGRYNMELDKKKYEIKITVENTDNG